MFGLYHVLSVDFVYNFIMYMWYVIVYLASAGILINTKG